MPQNAIVSLIENIIILLVFSVIFDFYWIKFRETKRQLMKYSTGILIGMIGICLIVKDLQWFESIRIDSRTVLLSLVGLFFGTVPTIIATIIILFYRICMIGGSWQILVLESIYTVIAGFSGNLYAYITPKWYNGHWLRTLLHVAYTPHVVMFACLAMLPSQYTSSILAETSWVVLIVFPAATVLLGMLMLDQKKRWDLKLQLDISEERFNKVALCSDDIFWEMDPRGIISYVSDSIKEILGYTPEEVIGHSPRMIINDFESINSLVEYSSSPDDINTPYNKVIVFRHKNLSRIICKARGLKKMDSLGKVVGFIGVVHDITQIQRQQEQMVYSQKVILAQNNKYMQLNKELEETNNKIVDYNIKLQELNKKAEQADKAKLSFISHVSHEIKMPLTDIYTSISKLLETGLSAEEQKNLLLQIQDNSNFIIRLADDIMDSDRITSGAIKLKMNIVNLEEMINDIFEYYASQNLYVYKKPIILKKTLELSEGDQVIKTDQTRLRQILGNLITNAFKFTNTGKIEITCKKYNEDSLLFSVSDTGVGVPEDAHDYIFSPYNHKEQPFMKQALLENTGLGLYICQQLITKMGGNIWFNSEVGKGTTFYFTMPYIHASEVAIKSSINYNWNDKKALVIGVDKFNIILVSETLAKTKIKYKALFVNDLVENGIATTEYFQYFDIIIIEKALADLKKIQRFLTNYPQTPILLLDDELDPSSLLEKIKMKMFD